MLDKTGDQQINYREFLCGIAPLVTGEVKEKLNFSFELYDVDGNGTVKKMRAGFFALVGTWSLRIVMIKF